MKPSKKTYLLLCAIPAVGIFVAGCGEQTINPFGKKKGSYSIYGALSLNKTRNYVRVKDLTQSFFPDSIPKLDASVIFEDLQKGTAATLKDTVIEFSGNYTDNFPVDHSLEPNGKYRITVTRSDGKSASSVATAPGIAQASISPSYHVGCSKDIHISFTNVLRPEYVQMKIGFFHNGAFISREIGKILKLSYESDEQMGLNGTILDLLMEVFPNPHLGDPRFPQDELLPTVLCDELDSAKAVVSYTHFGPEWAKYQSIFTGDPTKSFDVTGGLGFLGAFRRDSLTFTVDTTSAM